MMSYSTGPIMALLVAGALSLTTIPGSVVSAAENESEVGDITRGAQSWAENCMRCHNMRAPREFRDDLWKPIVTHMRVRAGLTGQEARDILAFIQNSN